MSSVTWVLICAALNFFALIVVTVLTMMTSMSEIEILTIASFFVVLSVLPYNKAMKQYAKESTGQ